MKFTTKSRYALRLMLDLALYDNGDYIALKDISKRQEISIKYLEQIVSQLNKAGLLISTRGSQGGYRLAKKASELTTGDILRVTEGSLAPISCLEEGHGDCSRMASCATAEFWNKLYTTMNTYFDNVTLEDLVNSHRKKMPIDFSI